MSRTIRFRFPSTAHWTSLAAIHVIPSRTSHSFMKLKLVTFYGITIPAEKYMLLLRRCF